MEEALIAADVGGAATLELVDAARERFRADGGRTGDDVRRALATEIRDRLARVGSGQLELGDPPAVILFVGVNGTGKTTTIAKLAAPAARGEGTDLVLAAADTFRAAAIEQLRIWGEQLGVPVVAQRAGADPGAVAFDAVAAAESRGLRRRARRHRGPAPEQAAAHGRAGEDPARHRAAPAGQPRHVLLVLDATTGQNGLVQAEAFSREAGVTGIVLTKLDGTAKGGVALAAAERLGVPILFAGVGEEIDALAPFEPEAFVEWLFAD